MELKNRVTEPSIRSLLVFTEKEVKIALTEYAEQKGYRFNHYNISVWYPRKENIDTTTTLIVDQAGAESGIRGI